MKYRYIRVLFCSQSSESCLSWPNTAPLFSCLLIRTLSTEHYRNHLERKKDKDKDSLQRKKRHRPKPLRAAAIQHLPGFHNWHCIMFITPSNYITCFDVSSGTAEGFIFLGGRKHTPYTNNSAAANPSATPVIYTTQRNTKASLSL